MAEFDDLNRGDQFIRLLEIEYQGLLNYARMEITKIQSNKDRYEYTGEELDRLNAQIAEATFSIHHYEEILRGLRGAENEELVLTGEKPESLEQFARVTCTTVL